MSTQISRRNFLRSSLFASLAGTSALGMGMPSRLLADCATVEMPRTLVNLMFYGGMDSRFIFMPAPNHPSPAYLDQIWQARQSVYPAGYTSYEEMFTAEYDRVSDPDDPSFEFGIFNRCGWLKSEFEAGRVAIVANSFCSRNRRHDQSQLNANLGLPEFNDLLYDQSGWGGRLTEQLTAANTVELSHEISVFGNGSVDGERLKNVIHAKDMRDIALPNVNPDRSVTDRRNMLTRALKSYYQSRGDELKQNTDSPFNIFFQHNTAFREFGDSVQDRLDSCGDLPLELTSLDLNSRHFAQQCRNLYDVCLAPDVLGVRTVSMRYDGWDTHNNQHDRISSNLEDVFGLAGGLATAIEQIATIPTLGVPASQQLTFCVTSDFGRQLRANGDRGTDHGRGLYTILGGYDVRGGIYGDMFPEREAAEDADGTIPFEKSGADIQGLTSTERILAEACEWLQPGSSGAVFPNAVTAEIESPGLLDNLFYS
jgi:uncharacterized protein (DUF1501 family)